MPQNIGQARAAGVPLGLQPFTALTFDRVKVAAGHELPLPSEQTRVCTILLVSEDAALGHGLCLAAAKTSLSVVQAISLREAMEQVNRIQPKGILLDMDLSADAGWQVAEWFLGHGPSLPILMFTCRVDHHELEAAVRSGVVFEKSLGSARLLRVLNSLLEESVEQGRGRLALLQALLRRAKPYRWECATTHDYRYWGINE